MNEDGEARTVVQSATTISGGSCISSASAIASSGSVAVSDRILNVTKRSVPKHRKRCQAWTSKKKGTAHEWRDQFGRA